MGFAQNTSYFPIVCRKQVLFCHCLYKTNSIFPLFAENKFYFPIVCTKQILFCHCLQKTNSIFPLFAENKFYFAIVCTKQILFCQCLHKTNSGTSDSQQILFDQKGKYFCASFLLLIYLW